MTYDDFLQKLKSSEPFSFSRYGDGEWNCILKYSKDPELKPAKDKPFNCDGHEYFEDMSIALARIVKSEPEYIMGIQNMAKRLMGDKIDKFCDGLNIDWTNSDILHNASIKGRLEEFFSALKDKFVIFVAPGYIQNNIWPYINYKAFYPIPRKNCWNHRERIVEWLENILSMYHKENVVVLFCASMATNVIIDDIYNKVGNKYTLIDAGSVFDPYCGERTRGYHKNLKV